jgi:hypothetical protein
MLLSQIVIHVEIDFKNNNQKIYSLLFWTLTETEAFQFLNLLHESDNQIS